MEYIPEALEELDRRIKEFQFKASEIKSNSHNDKHKKRYNLIQPMNKTKLHPQDELIDRIEMWITKCSFKKVSPDVRTVKPTKKVQRDRSLTRNIRLTKHTPPRRSASMESISLPSMDTTRTTPKTHRNKQKSFTLNSKSLKDFKFHAANAKKRNSCSRSTTSLNLLKNKIERDDHVGTDKMTRGEHVGRNKIERDYHVGRDKIESDDHVSDDDSRSNSSETESSHSDIKDENESIDEHKQKKRTFLLNLLSRKSKNSPKKGVKIEKTKKYDTKSKSSSSLAPYIKKEELINENMKNDLKTNKCPSILQKELIALSAPDISKLICDKPSIDLQSYDHMHLEGRHSWVGPHLNKNIVYIDEMF